LEISADLVGNLMIGQALSNLNRRVGTESQAPPNVVGQLTTHSMGLFFATQKVNLLGISTEALPEQSLINASSTNGLFAEFDPFVEGQAGLISGLWPRKEGADSFSLTRTELDKPCGPIGCALAELGQNSLHP